MPQSADVTPEHATPAPEASPGAYPSFLLSLALPGAAQMRLGVPARGAVFLTLATTYAAAVALDFVRLPVGNRFNLADGVALALASALWIFSAYDAWFRARENANDMSPLLPRTPRVAAFADLLWGGAGHLYLGLRAGIGLVLVTGGILAVLLVTRTTSALATLLGWNVLLAMLSHPRAARRYHATPEYTACKERLEAAPFASPLAPSPSLPLATLVAVVIAFMGVRFAQRALAEVSVLSHSLDATQAVLRSEGAAAGASRRLGAGHFVDPEGGVSLILPAVGWTFTSGAGTTLLEGRSPSTREAFSLTAVRSAFFGDDGVLPAGALARFAVRQEEELRRALPNFERLSLATDEPPGAPGVRLVYRAALGESAQIHVQHTLLHHGRILILTLSGPPELGVDRLAADLDILLSGLSPAEPGPS